MLVKFGALVITRSRIINILKLTICNIPLNLLGYTFRHIINNNLYIYLYKHAQTTSCYYL
jgi:hypothetical protein